MIWMDQGRLKKESLWQNSWIQERKKMCKRKNWQKLKVIKVLVENKEKLKGTAWSKERMQKQAEIMRRYLDKRKARMRKEK